MPTYVLEPPNVSQRRLTPTPTLMPLLEKSAAKRSYILDASMIRTPYASDVLVLRENILPSNLLVLFATSLHQQLGLLEHLLHLQVPHANGFLAAIDVVASEDWVFVWTGRYSDLDLRMRFREGHEEV